jgi:ribosomal protein S18 acetylase RimI-like enzyme
VACGLIMIEGGYTGLFDICTAPRWRRQGIGQALCFELLQAGREQGADRAWLSVLADNEPALRLYEKLGFHSVYEYWYRRPRS